MPNETVIGALAPPDPVLTARRAVDANRVHGTVPRQEITAAGQQVPESGDDLRSGSRDLEAVVNKLNDFVQQVNRELNFSVDEHSGRTIIKVVDSATNEVIRQIPPEEVLSVADYFGERSGMLLRTQV